jgi:23S rRNA (cytidine1920-2'-O)/16S rRNA (cytidine1409-2'-O)-methyltransferase
MMKQRLDQRLVSLGLVASRSQAESYIKLGEVTVEGRVITKPGLLVDDNAQLRVTVAAQYVSRAALKLASVASHFGLDFTNKTVLDVGSSTGGFSDYALHHGATSIIAVELGSDQLHPRLRADPRISLHEKTDIRAVHLIGTPSNGPSSLELTSAPDIILADVSFISLRDILPHLATLALPATDIVVMLKPQFEAGHHDLKHGGVIKNDRMRRTIVQDFETWLRSRFVLINKADSDVSGAKGNRERFYVLRRM